MRRGSEVGRNAPDSKSGYGPQSLYVGSNPTLSATLKFINPRICPPLLGKKANPGFDFIVWSIVLTVNVPKKHLNRLIQTKNNHKF